MKQSTVNILANFLTCVYFFKPQYNNSSGLLIFILYLSDKEFVKWYIIVLSHLLRNINCWRGKCYNFRPENTCQMSYMKLTRPRVYALVIRRCPKYYGKALGMMGLNPHLYLTAGMFLCLHVLCSYFH